MSQEVEIVCNGTVHYRRPITDPMVMEALRTPGYSVRNPVLGGLTPDKAKLWDELKALKEAEVDSIWSVTRKDGQIYTVGNLVTAYDARRVLQEMLQMETLASVKEGV